MLTVTRLDGSPIVVNADLIESIEAIPDTMITRVNDVMTIRMVGIRLKNVSRKKTSRPEVGDASPSACACDST